MAFPSVLNTFNRPTTTDKLNSPSHSGLHNTVSSALGQVEAMIGVVGNASVVGTLSYDVRSPASGGGGHVQVANKGGTGYTSYTKGDILVAQSSSVLTKLAIGDDGSAIVADASKATGIKWGVPGVKPTIKAYTTPSTMTWYKPSTLSYIKVKMVGGGGGGAGSGGDDIGGGGGGASGYSEKVIAASLLGLTEVLIVGSGGNGQNSNSVPGDTGGLSKFGAFVSVVGGYGGSYTQAGGGGSLSDSGDINLIGANGQDGQGNATVSFGGIGGSTRYGSGGGLKISWGNGVSTGSSTSVYGAGGGGGISYGAGSVFGGRGGPGLVIIEEY